MTFNLDMTVEIPFNSSVKYEFDKYLNQMRCDRLLTTSMLYPGNYGYIPETLSGDGDPLDILLVCDYSIYPGTVVNVKVIGVLLTTDEKGEDEKLIAVPSNSVDPSFADINTLEDLGTLMKKRILHFFKHYKDIDENKWVEIRGFRDAEEANTIYTTSIQRNNLRLSSDTTIPELITNLKKLTNEMKIDSSESLNHIIKLITKHDEDL
jgi:inorganic pyrophosphatase